MNLSALTREWNAEKTSGSYIKDKAIKGLNASIGTNGSRYPTEVRNKALNMLRQGLSFKSVQDKIGIADSTLRKWHKSANAVALVA